MNHQAHAENPNSAEGPWKTLNKLTEIKVIILDKQEAFWLKNWRMKAEAEKNLLSR